MAFGNINAFMDRLNAPSVSRGREIDPRFVRQPSARGEALARFKELFERRVAPAQTFPRTPPGSFRPNIPRPNPRTGPRAPNPFEGLRGVDVGIDPGNMFANAPVGPNGRPFISRAGDTPQGGRARQVPPEVIDLLMDRIRSSGLRR